jgi:hypothetical protein
MYHIVAYKDSKYACNDSIFGYTNSLTKIINFIFRGFLSRHGMLYSTLEPIKFSLADNLVTSILYLLCAPFSPFLTNNFQSSKTTGLGLITPIIRTYQDLTNFLAENRDNPIACKFFINKSKVFKEALEGRFNGNNINQLKKTFTEAELKKILSLYIQKTLGDHEIIELVDLFEGMVECREYLSSDSIDELFSPYYEKIRQAVTENTLECIWNLSIIEGENRTNLKKEMLDLMFSEKFFDKQSFLNKVGNFKFACNIPPILFPVLSVLEERIPADELKLFYSVHREYLNLFAEDYCRNHSINLIMLRDWKNRDCLKLMRGVLALKNLETKNPKFIWFPKDKPVYRTDLDPIVKKFQKDFRVFAYSKFTDTEFKTRIASLFNEHCAYLNKDVFDDLKWIANGVEKENFKTVVSTLIVDSPDLEVEYKRLVNKLLQPVFFTFSNYDLNIEFG